MIVFTKLVEKLSVPSGILKSITVRTIELDVNTDDDLCQLYGPYYETVYADRYQKPYFIWSCNDAVINRGYDYKLLLVKSIREICCDWSIALKDEDIYLGSVVSDDTHTTIYHLIINNYFHSDGHAAQLFRDEVLNNIGDPSEHSSDISSKHIFMESRSAPRCSTRHVLYLGGGSNGLITHVAGKLMFKKQVWHWYDYEVIIRPIDGLIIIGMAMMKLFK